MTNTTSVQPDIAALQTLLEKLIAAPVDEAITPHFDDVQKELKAQHIALSEVANTSHEIKESVKQTSRRLANLQTTLENLLNVQLPADRAFVAASIETFRQEWQVAQTVAASERAVRMELECQARRKLVRTLAAIASGAGILGAGVVELVHLLL